jgi:hypothetical protein
MTGISNINTVSVRTYGKNSDTLAVIRELKKLGVIKSAKRKTKSKAKTMDELKQESDMVGYVKTLEGEPNRADPNLFALRQIEPGMSEQDIRDLHERNAAGVATLRAEIQQQRLADIEAQQGQRFADITKLGGIMNPILERFRGAQNPGAGQRIDPFTQTSTIFLPDVQEETFTETLNEGGPRAQPQVQTELFAESEEEEARLGPQERLQIGGGGMSSAAAQALGMPASFIAKTKKAGGEVRAQSPVSPRAAVTRITRRAFLEENGLGNIPPNTKKTDIQTMRDYYVDFSQVFGVEVKDSYLNNKDKMYREMVQIIDDEINLTV